MWAPLCDMWAPLAALAHWLNSGDHDSFRMMDDGERCTRLIGLVGRAFATMLHTIDQAGELKAGAQFHDLGLVISLYLKWGTGQGNYGIEPEDLDWSP